MTALPGTVLNAALNTAALNTAALNTAALNTAAAHPVLPPATLQVGHSWEPVSPCTPDCLPEAGALPRVGATKVAARLAGMITLIVTTMVLAPVLPLLGAARRARVLRGLFRGVLRVIGVRLVHRGTDRFDAGPGSGGVLMVANHLSWLDIMVLSAVQPMRIVAKREVREWPLLGGLAVRLGTLFIDRAGLRSLPDVVAGVAAALRGGAVVGLFPEGTTWCGAATGEFRRAGFQAALDAGVPVRPVAQVMRLLDGTPTSVAAFVGDDTLCDSLLRVLRLPGMVIEVEVLPLLVPAAGTDRRELARRAQLAVAAATGVPAPPVTRRAPVATAQRPAALSAAA
jgi:1-acyl-sn-glycerol-3-phosphate acyltransferase